MSTFNVAKFGGTSVANFEAMSRCSAIIENNPQTRLVGQQRLLWGDQFIGRTRQWRDLS